MTNSIVRRLNEGLLQPLERPALQYMAKRLPESITPDMLTTFGFVGAVMTFVGFAFAQSNPLLLLFAAAGLVINWLGDSLDGTVARYRRIERPTYGFFVDHTTDVFEQVIIVLGIAMSGYIRFELAILGLIVYLLFSVLTFARSQYISTLQISYAGFGPTELRLALILLAIAIIVFPPQPMHIWRLEVTYPNLLSALWSSIGSIVLAFQVISTWRELKAESPDLQ